MSRRRHRHDGRGRRDPAGAGDRDRAAVAGQPQRAGPARGAAMTEPNPEQTGATPTDLVADSTQDSDADGVITEPLAVDAQDPQPQAEQAEFEGPRRRARRERAERRAAQARAQAIEDNRRAAKRRATGRIV